MSFTQTFAGHKLNESLLTQAKHAFADLLLEKRPVLSLPHEPTRVSELEPIATYFREKFETVVLLGTGGSSLGGQALVALAQDAWGFQSSGPKLIFLDNIDPDTFDRFFQATDLTTTGFLVVSKSGNTAETLCQLQTILQVWNERHNELDPKDHVLIITEPKASTLSSIAEQHNFTILPHDTNIGGRFAALSLVGLLPAMIAGLNGHKILEGAQAILDAGEKGTFITGSAWTMANYNAQHTLSVMMPYCDRLQLFCKWFRQLWAESLGKEGKGITPIAAYGTVDQHSQLQLYLDGPKDKMFTILATQHKGRGNTLKTGPQELAGHSMGDLMQAEQLATIETLQRRGCPVRVFDVPSMHEQALGGLMMHFMLETMITARMMKINAFDQPAVEEGKILAMQYLHEDKAA
jgi:glucose-6-phosphate isomerase